VTTTVDTVVAEGAITRAQFGTASLIQCAADLARHTQTAALVATPWFAAPVNADLFEACVRRLGRARASCVSTHLVRCRTVLHMILEAQRAHLPTAREAVLAVSVHKARGAADRLDLVSPPGCWSATCRNLQGDSEATIPALRKCGGCRVARYCSPECQREAWRSGHKVACLSLSAPR
jgi:hypothetical protein